MLDTQNSIILKFCGQKYKNKLNFGNIKYISTQYYSTKIPIACYHIRGGLP